MVSKILKRVDYLGGQKYIIFSSSNYSKEENE